MPHGFGHLTIFLSHSVFSLEIKYIFEYHIVMYFVYVRYKDSSLLHKVGK